MTEMLVCIYCMEAKPVSAYLKAEHVLPQSFGRFTENLTLNQVVCDPCNEHFGKTIDRELARGSVDGLDRFRFGRRAAKEYAHLGRAMTRRDRLADGPLAGLKLTWGPDQNGALTSMPLPQLGFRREGSDERVWYLLHELPTAAQAAELGLSTEDVRTEGLDDLKAEALKKSLQEKGGDLETLATFAPIGEQGSVQIEITQQFDAQFFRAIAKIGLNYVASQFGAEIARNKTFDAVRRYALYGEKPFTGWYRPYKAAPTHPEFGKLGHLIWTHWDEQHDFLQVRVSLHSQRCYEMRLTSGPLLRGRSMQRCHFFDLESMKARRINIGVL